jgi:hypothetical protein
MNQRRTWSIAAVIALWLCGPWPAPAAERCTAKIDPSTGEVAISATDVAPNPRWGTAPGAATQAFAEEATCLVGTKLRKCGLGAPGTLAARTPPPRCSICVADDSPAPACCVDHITGCTPGVRIADASFPPGDPRLPAAGGPVDADTLDGFHAADFAMIADLPSISYTAEFSAQRNNSGGTSSVAMTSTSGSICFLTSVAFEDTDSGGEWAECRVVPSAGVWRLQASLGRINDIFGGEVTDSDAWCRARCLVWN